VSSLFVLRCAAARSCSSEAQSPFITELLERQMKLEMSNYFHPAQKISWDLEYERRHQRYAARQFDPKIRVR
jgi:hypothetical protein